MKLEITYQPGADSQAIYRSNRRVERRGKLRAIIDGRTVASLWIVPGRDSRWRIAWFLAELAADIPERIGPLDDASVAALEAAGA